MQRLQQTPTAKQLLFLSRINVPYQKVKGNNKVEAISLGADANHRIAFARAVPQWKKWFDEMLVTPTKSTSK